MKFSQLAIGVVLVSVVILGVSYYSGAQTGRWGHFSGLPESQQLLKALPMQMGDWVAEKESELDSASVTELKIQNSYICRTYKNTKTLAVVYLTIMVGPSGRVTVHTPDICFGGRNYVRESNRTAVTFAAALDPDATRRDDAFWLVSFVSNAIGGLESGKISFYYGISAGSEWVASEIPRYEFRKFGYVYKLQAESRVDGGTDNVKDFLQDCLPVIHQHLRVVQ